MKRILSTLLIIGCVLTCVTSCYAEVAEKTDIEVMFEAKAQENVTIDQEVQRRQEEINLLFQRKAENIGAMKLLQELAAKEAKLKAEEKAEAAKIKEEFDKEIEELNALNEKIAEESAKE